MKKIRKWFLVVVVMVFAGMMSGCGWSGIYESKRVDASVMAYYNSETKEIYAKVLNGEVSNVELQVSVEIEGYAPVKVLLNLEDKEVENLDKYLPQYAQNKNLNVNIEDICAYNNDAMLIIKQIIILFGTISLAILFSSIIIVKDNDDDYREPYYRETDYGDFDYREPDNREFEEVDIYD